MTVHDPDTQTGAGDDPAAIAAVGEPTTTAVKIPPTAAAATNLNLSPNASTTAPLTRPVDTGQMTPPSDTIQTPPFRPAANLDRRS